MSHFITSVLAKILPHLAKTFTLFGDRNGRKNVLDSLSYPVSIVSLPHLQSNFNGAQCKT